MFRSLRPAPRFNGGGKRAHGFRELRRNIRGQHINFYSRVIHNAKTINKSGLVAGFMRNAARFLRD
jgi:hypothetical protein